MNKQDQRYIAEEFIFDTEPYDFVRRVRSYLPAAGRALNLTMGEGRNDAFLTQCGLSAEGIDSSPVAAARVEKIATPKGMDSAMRTAGTTVVRMSLGHYVVISSVCYHFTEPVHSRLAWGVIDALVSDGLFIGVFYHPEQAALEKGPKDRTALADMVELQTAFGGLEWLIAGHCRMGEGGEARSTVCLLGRKTLSDSI